MTESNGKTIAVCIGASKYDDRKLPALAAAADSAKSVADALDRNRFDAVHAIIDPGRSDDIFVALSKFVKDAKRGSLLVYFSGNVLRRDNELLLAAGASEAEPPAGCVPLSDLDDLLLRELVSDALIVLNVHQGPGGGITPKLTRGGVSIVGYSHSNGESDANARVRASGEAIVAALKAPAKTLEPSLTDGKLDGDALARHLKTAGAGDVLHVSNGSKLALRDLREDLERAAKEAAEKAAAEKAAAEKAEAEKAAAEKAAAEKAAAEKAAAEKAAAEKAAVPAPTAEAKPEAAAEKKPAAEVEKKPAAAAEKAIEKKHAATPPATAAAAAAESPALQTNFRLGDLWLYALIVSGIIGGASWFMLHDFVRGLLQH